MNRRAFNHIFAGAVLGRGLPLAAQEKDSRPNIIFLLTDDQRRDSLGCYGNHELQTPNIHRLARDGVLFENAFVTSLICTPSRACYFLGQYERRHGINFNSGTSLDRRRGKKATRCCCARAAISPDTSARITFRSAPADT